MKLEEAYKQVFRLDGYRPTIDLPLRDNPNGKGDLGNEYRKIFSPSEKGNPKIRVAMDEHQELFKYDAEKEGATLCPRCREWCFYCAPENGLCERCERVMHMISYDQSIIDLSTKKL